MGTFRPENAPSLDIPNGPSQFMELPVSIGIGTMVESQFDCGLSSKKVRKTAAVHPKGLAFLWAQNSWSPQVIIAATCD